MDANARFAENATTKYIKYPRFQEKHTITAVAILNQLKRRNDTVLILDEVRCPVCKRKLMELKGTAQVKCTKCKSLVAVDTEARKIYIIRERQK